MLLVGIARHYLVLLLNSPGKPVPLKELREQRGLLRGQILRSNARYLPAHEFEKRREWLMNAFERGYFIQAKARNEDGSEVATSTAPNPLDPAAMDGMIGMLKKQAVMFIPQSILMGWINLFFSGFVLSECVRRIQMQ